MNPTLTDPSSYYNFNAQSLHQKWLKEKAIGDLLPFLEMLEPGARVLDLGCGNGIDLVWMVKSGFQGVGIDSSSELVSAARAIHANSGVEIQEKNFLFLNLKEAEFDGVWSHLSLSEIPAEVLQRVLAICFKGVKVGGVMGAVLYEGTGSFEEKDHSFQSTRKIHLYSEKALCSMFDQTGFQVVKVGRKKGADGMDQILILAKRV